MIYVFVFLGEFGYELLNWQGVIRKFAKTISPADKIVCCSRAHLYPLYESAEVYIDISDVELFRRSRASGYFAHPDRADSWDSVQSQRFHRRLKSQLQEFILDRLRATNGIESGEPCTFIFSSEGLKLNGCKFGRFAYRYSPLGAVLGNLYRGLKSILPVDGEGIDELKVRLFETIQPLDHRAGGNIYDLLDVENNTYRIIEPDLGVLKIVAKQLGWEPADQPYVLCQARWREIGNPSGDVLPREKMGKLIDTLASKVKVVLLFFHTGRWLDSYSEFEDSPNCFSYHGVSFPEQACLIHFASHCLFFSEGDYGSHIYVPPLMGKDVTAIAPRSVYDLDSVPIDFWNREVFRFGGQIIPKTSEEVFASDESLLDSVQDTLQRSILALGTGSAG